jgi:hypothetical protein
MDINFKPKFQLKQAVYFMQNNRIKKSTIIGIIFPSVWIGDKGKLQQTSFSYRVKSLTRKDYGNTYGILDCLLFATKKELMKTL